MNIPDKCFDLNNMTIDPKTGIGEIIRIVALEKGYHRTAFTGTQFNVDNMNKEIGVEKATAKAMAWASMFGWDTYLTMLETYKELEKKGKI